MEKELILDRIKGCLAAIVLSDAINNVSRPANVDYKRKQRFHLNPNYKRKPIPEQHLCHYKGINVTDMWVMEGFNDNPDNIVQPSSMMRSLIECMNALMKWKEDLQHTGIYADPLKYIDAAIDKSLWDTSINVPVELKPFWSTAVPVGVLGNWLFDFSEDINRDIKIVATCAYNNIEAYQNIEDNNEYIEKEKTMYGVFAAVLRELITYEKRVDVSRFLLFLRDCAITNRWGDERICNMIAGNAVQHANCLDNPESMLAREICKTLEWKGLSQIESGNMQYDFLYGGIRYSSILGCINGYKTFPFKGMLKYVGAMHDIDRLMIEIENHYMKV